MSNNNPALLLEDSIKHNRVPHGIVLESQQPHLIDKYTAMLSKWAVCTENSKPCIGDNICVQCHKAETGNHPDIYVAQVSGKTEIINVDEIRKICNDAYIKPNEATVKVYILPNADKMQHQAQNAFLKILEEPPQSILFILQCANSSQLLGTIRSRVTVYNLDKKDNPAREEKEEATEIAEKIALSLTKSKGYDLLCAIGEMGSNRSLAKSVVEQLNIIICNAVKASVAGLQCTGTEKQLTYKIETTNLLNIINTLNTATAMLKSNINTNLFTAWLCAELRRQK